MTKHTNHANDELEALMADIDLSILGTFDEDIWAQYNHAIRQEYNMIPLKEYVKGRIEVLKSFLNKNCIFQTDFFYDMFEAQARQNISKEIELLKGLKV